MRTFYAQRANQTLQVGRIGHNYFVLTDDRGWQWEVADYSDYGFNCYIHINAADAAGLEQPAHDVAPGFDSGTAVVFDIPADAKGLSLVSERLGILLPYWAYWSLKYFFTHLETELYG